MDQRGAESESETSLGVSCRVWVRGASGLDAMALVVVWEALGTCLAQSESSVLVLLVPVLVTLDILVTPNAGQDSAGPKAERLSGRPQTSPVRWAVLLTLFYR